ncbi:hypothetical protein [Streptomyces europaeiscabiei]|uniref:hypothetical protein n=1 Tax=Streptomyces europaeiscabiei TaxID=146819 RepID=UPI0029B75722|nr:hypothetical protein [Streptomyces europaeiscabiei]MDX3589038.1 hypothetical protein [Streptomyces europaeiscabiei]
MSGPSHSPHTASALRSERRTRLRRLRTAGAAVPAVVAAGVLGLTSGGDDAQSKRRPVAVRQAPDDIRETVEKAPDSPEAAGPPTSSKRPRPWAGTSRPSVPGDGEGLREGIGDYVQAFTHGDESKELYELDVPTPLCAVRRHAGVAGWTAVAHLGQSPDQDEDPTTKAMSLPCDRLVVFDVDTGRKKWDVKLPGEAAPCPSTSR